MAPCLRAWARAGLRLAVYSSGSVGAQKLLFGHSAAGDLTPLFTGFFDTKVGGKRDAASYATIAAGLHVPPGEVLFLSDVVEELDAAAGRRPADLPTGPRRGRHAARRPARRGGRLPRRRPPIRAAARRRLTVPYAVTLRRPGERVELVKFRPVSVLASHRIDGVLALPARGV